MREEVRIVSSNNAIAPDLDIRGSLQEVETGDTAIPTQLECARFCSTHPITTHVNHASRFKSQLLQTPNYVEVADIYIITYLHPTSVKYGHSNIAVLPDLRAIGPKKSDL